MTTRALVFLPLPPVRSHPVFSVFYDTFKSREPEKPHYTGILTYRFCRRTILTPLTETIEQWLRLADQIGAAEFRQLLLSRGLSKDRLSKTLRISQVTLHFYEQGRRKIPKELVYKILELWPDRTVTPSEITELRHTSGLTQSQAAAAIGLTRYAIGPYEAGKRKISYNISQKIMEFYREQVEDSDPDKQN